MEDTDLSGEEVGCCVTVWARVVKMGHHRGIRVFSCISARLCPAHAALLRPTAVSGPSPGGTHQDRSRAAVPRPIRKVLCPENPGGLCRRRRSLGSTLRGVDGTAADHFEGRTRGTGGRCQWRPARRRACCSARSCNACSLASCRHSPHTSRLPSRTTLVPRQLAEVDRIRAALGVLAVAAVTREPVLEGCGHPLSIEQMFDRVHNRQPISVVSGTGLILPAL